jgi:glycosyltransferase involved in cell wall biosynthesis
MAEALDHLRPSTVWMDVTTSWRSRSGPTDGTLRVEQSYAAALQEVMPDRLRLCRYHAVRRRFIPVAALPNVKPSAQAMQRMDNELAVYFGGKAEIGRRTEQALRYWRRSVSVGINRWLDHFRDSVPFRASRAGDILLLAGETWGRHDFTVLRSLRQRHGVRIAAICQDLIPIKCPQFFEADGFVERFQRYADFLVKDVDLVIAISESTRRDVLDYARVRGGLHGDIQTIELGHDLGRPTVDDRPASLTDLEPKEFVLSVSAIQLRKNLDLLYRVWRSLSEERLPNLPKLVIIGRRGVGSDDFLRQIARDPIVRDTVVIIPVVSDAVLSWLYCNCAWTLYPSFYEGWGLPISESLGHGKFCLASNMSALKEAGQGLVRHIDPHDFTAWRAAVVELVRSPKLVLEFQHRIKARYRRVTWLQSAAYLAGLLRTLCDKPA